MSLFQIGNFTLASGENSTWKIECDALTLLDWQTLAKMIAERCEPFGDVIGVPRGGLPLAQALVPYITSGRRLVVDDVFTTGKSLSAIVDKNDIVWVAFARNQCPKGIHALFQIHE